MTKQKTLEQQIINQQLKLNSLKAKARKLNTKQKIIIGSLVLSIAKQNPNTTDWLKNQIHKIKNPKDLEDVKNLIKKIHSAQFESFFKTNF